MPLRRLDGVPRGLGPGSLVGFEDVLGDPCLVVPEPCDRDLVAFREVVDPGIDRRLGVDGAGLDEPGHEGARHVRGYGPDAEARAGTVGDAQLTVCKAPRGPQQDLAAANDQDGAREVPGIDKRPDHDLRPLCQRVRGVGRRRNAAWRYWRREKREEDG